LTTSKPINAFIDAPSEQPDANEIIETGVIPRSCPNDVIVEIAIFEMDTVGNVTGIKIVALKSYVYACAGVICR
jgi:hypothetical protein